LNAILKFADFDLGCTTNFDDCNSTGKASNTFLNLFLVVLAVGSVLLLVEYFNALFNSFGLTGTSHDDGIVFGNNDLLGTSEALEAGLVKSNTKIFRDEFCACGNSNVLHGVTAVVSETGGFDSADFEAST